MTLRIRLGFMPLLDAAIPVAAARCGFAKARGITIDLVRETSWANIRDRLAIGHFDAAHLLAPMPVAATLGLTPLDVPLIAPIALGLGGNAVTVSDTLWQHMLALSPQLRVNDPVLMGAALRLVMEERRKRGEKPLVFGVVHPFSSHNYELRYWLAASSIAPDHDIDIAIMPPPFMPDALASGRIDGFCVGEPWNTLAAGRGGARIILTKSAIWRSSPEKVLGLRADWASDNPDHLDALLAALIEAAHWCGDRANHAALADLMGERDLLDLPPAMLAPALVGHLPMADGVAGTPEFLTFEDYAATFPWRSHALWFLSQMQRWGQAPHAPGLAERAAGVFRPDIYRRAAAICGLNVPAIDMKPEGAASGEWTADGTLGPLVLPRGGFFDGRPFDPAMFMAQAGSDQPADDA